MLIIRSIFLVLVFIITSCIGKPTESRKPDSAPKTIPNAFKIPIMEHEPDDIYPWPEELEASMGVTDPQRREQQLAEYFENLCAQNPENCIEKIGGKGNVLEATLLKKQDGLFYLDVAINNQHAYSCLASPGRNSFLGMDKEYGRTPTVYRVNPFGLEKLHIVGETRSYKGAQMPYTVWIIGNVAIHGLFNTKPTGRRRSHGCINLSLKCAEKFYFDVQKAGLRNTFVTVQEN
ncbi:MAG: L,D-transpeptidase [Bdellovibrionales bacterium]|nr:L,D-transpeptidase [Bdellovibrionales bacterium]